MTESSKLFLQKTTDINFNEIKSDIISNHNLINYNTLSVSKYIDQLSMQIHSPVMWSDTIKTIIKSEVDTFVEIGPKKTLLNFIPKSYEGEKIFISNSEDINNYV
tara:strand:+ start:17 stop:331 length:315 start_codon:yes stop_codon:yes gene_type:complete